MARYLLDTTFLIDYLRGDPLAVARFARFFEEGDDILLNEVVVCEARTGLRPQDMPLFEALLAPTEFVQPGPESALTAGAWRVEARQRGRALSLADALIAAAAESSQATVLTRNVRDVSLTPARVETY